MLLERLIKIGTCETWGAYYNTRRLSCFHWNFRKFFNSLLVKSFKEDIYAKQRYHLLSWCLLPLVTEVAATQNFSIFFFFFFFFLQSCLPFGDNRTILILWCKLTFHFSNFLYVCASSVAQQKRAGLITQRSVDRNHSLLHILRKKLVAVQVQ